MQRPFRRLSCADSLDGVLSSASWYVVDVSVGTYVKRMLMMHVCCRGTSECLWCFHACVCVRAYVRVWPKAKPLQCCGRDRRAPLPSGMCSTCLFALVPPCVDSVLGRMGRQQTLFNHLPAWLMCGCGGATCRHAIRIRCFVGPGPTLPFRVERGFRQTGIGLMWYVAPRYGVVMASLA